MTDRPGTLVVQKTIAATPERLFAAWTEPEELRRWWGPDGVTCIDPHVDLRVGGRYRIGNRLPDGSILWIVGEFEVIERPHRLTYTWRLEGSDAGTERVTVRFEGWGTATDVIVTHSSIATETLRDQHEHGWVGCLDGLARWCGAISQR
jgi:uncharacterized protein YndB with AHSA1/START domain